MSGAVWEIRQGHVLDLLSEIESGTVQTCITSPPYYGLRAYGTEPQVWGGDPNCTHTLEAGPSLRPMTGGAGPKSAKQVTNNGSQFGNAWAESSASLEVGNARTPSATLHNPSAKYCATAHAIATATCTLCGAWRGELGSEPTVDIFIHHLVLIFREVRRVLRDDATCWLNLGDSYSGSGKGASTGPINGKACKQASNIGAVVGATREPGLASKNLLLTPWRLAIALQDDGWIVRSVIVWAKRAPMPESVTDRPTSSWEPIFLLSKQERYYYDAEAVAEEAAKSTQDRAYLGQRPLSERQESMQALGMHGASDSLRIYDRPTRNLRNVWSLSPEPFPGSHFAVMPTEIARRAILAGTSQAGQCAEPGCGKPWARVVERLKSELTPRSPKLNTLAKTGVTRNGLGGSTLGTNGNGQDTWANRGSKQQTTGWAPTCSCTTDAPPVPQLVLDCFSGAGTTALVANRLGRRAVGLELNPEYAALSRDRIQSDAPLVHAIALAAADPLAGVTVQRDLFEAPAAGGGA